jgi:hypothetical protein
MTRLLAAAAVAAALIAPPAHAADSPGEGRRCGYVSSQDATMEWQDGGMYGGPFAIGAHTGRMTCTLRYDGSQYDDPYGVFGSATSPDGTGVLVVPVTPIRYSAWDPVAICTTVEVDGVGTFYWDAAAVAWSADPATRCVTIPVLPTPPPELDPIGLLNDAFFEPYVDPVVCPVFGGDVSIGDDVWWDCPPYAS